MPSNDRSGFSRPIIIVAVVGVIAMVGTGVWLYLGNMVERPQIPVISTPVQKESAPLELTLDKPADGDVVVDKTLVLAGRTAPGVVVVMYTEEDQTSVESDASGNFEGSLQLENGINGVVVTAVSDSGEEKTINLDVVYDWEAK